MQINLNLSFVFFFVVTRTGRRICGRESFRAHGLVRAVHHLRSLRHAALTTEVVTGRWRHHSSRPPDLLRFTAPVRGSICISVTLSGALTFLLSRFETRRPQLSNCHNSRNPIEF